ncbi:MAG: hypothetical protein R3B99_25660 [Polyangiales bacterium]
MKMERAPRDDLVSAQADKLDSAGRDQERSSQLVLQARSRSPRRPSARPPSCTEYSPRCALALTLEKRRALAKLARRLRIGLQIPREKRFRVFFELVTRG